VPLGLVVLKDACTMQVEQAQQELVARVRDTVGAIACLRRVYVVERLPKTRSGKILRRTLHELADGENPAVPSTIDDPATLDEIRARLNT
jgi:propionyl-CoA synthetase